MGNFDDILEQFFADPIYVNYLRPQELKLTSWDEKFRPVLFDKRYVGDSVLNHGGESERLTDDSEYRNYEGIYG